MRLVCQFPRFYWDRKSSPVRRQIIQALLKSPEITGIVTGQGWLDYDETAPLQQNIDLLLPECDVVLYYKPYGNQTHRIAPLIDPERVNALRVLRLHDFWWDHRQRSRELMDGEIDLALCTQENDLSRVKELGVEAVHLPQTADPSIFQCDRLLYERQTPCLLTGVTSREHYPLRERLRALINMGRIPGVYRLPPPSYATDLSANESQFRNYAQHLGLSRVSLCTASKHNYALGKIVESMQAGCLVVSNMPDDGMFQRTLGKYIARIDADWSDDQICRKINSVVDDDAAQKLVSEGQRFAVRAYSHERYVEWFLDACQKRDGSRERKMKSESQ